MILTTFVMSLQLHCYDAKLSFWLTSLPNFRRISMYQPIFRNEKNLVGPTLSIQNHPSGLSSDRFMFIISYGWTSQNKFSEINKFNPHSRRFSSLDGRRRKLELSCSWKRWWPQQLLQSTSCQSPCHTLCNSATHSTSLRLQQNLCPPNITVTQELG